MEDLVESRFFVHESGMHSNETEQGAAEVGQEQIRKERVLRPVASVISATVAKLASESYSNIPATPIYKTKYTLPSYNPFTLLHAVTSLAGYQPKNVVRIVACPPYVGR
jgi:hypothetical protein